MASSSFIRLLPKEGVFVLPRRFNRHRIMPPEFSKKYFPQVSQRELEEYQRTSQFGDKKLRESDKIIPKTSPVVEAPRAIRMMYQELLPHNLDPRYRDRIRERLERREMMLRRRHLKIPEFYVGTIMAATVSDQFSPNQTNRFVGICIERNNEGLWSTFTLRNVVDRTAVEVNFELYNPTLLSIEVLLLEKRLDGNLLYLRDAALSESKYPFDFAPVPHEKGAPVPVNDKKVKLLPRPWHFQWQLHGYRGIDPDSLYGQLTVEELKTIESRVEYVDRYDLMKIYRSRNSPAEKNMVFGEVGLQHTQLLRHADLFKKGGRQSSEAS